MRTPRIFIGIDPGANGSLCTLNSTGDTSFIEYKQTGLLGYIDYLKTVLDQKPTIVVEKVHAMRAQGVVSVFSFGQRLGELEGMLQTLGLGYTLVRPQEWQKICGVKPKSGKKGIHEVMSKAYPQAPLRGPKGGIKDGNCDALGIAHYARVKYS